MPSITLHQHAPKSLLALLKPHLPYSLAVYGTLLSNPSHATEDPSEPSSSTTSRKQPTLSHAYATFPTSSLSSPPPLFVILINLPKPQQRQIRIFCSAESNPHLSPKKKQEAETLVVGAVRSLVEIAPWTSLVGAISELWAGAVLSSFGTQEREKCWSWLAPELGNSAGEEQRNRLWCRRGLSSTLVASRTVRSEIQAPLEYYITRLPYTTVVRPIGPKAVPPNYLRQPAVAWILTHSAGEQGALYVLPEYRRRGLARVVTEERVKQTIQNGMRGYVWVFEGNAASHQLWERMGWERGWMVQWVPLKDD